MHYGCREGTVTQHRISLNLYYQPLPGETIEQRHSEVKAALQRLDPPFGWKGLKVPELEIGDNLQALLTFEYPKRGTGCLGQYENRELALKRNTKAYDDKLHLIFFEPDPDIDYRACLSEGYPKLIAAYRAYRAYLGFDTLVSDYEFDMESDPVLMRFRADPEIDTNGRNNIFTLSSAMYWGGDLCKLALGYDRDEVIRRLQGKVPLVMPLMDGVYTVFSDNPDLTYEEFVAINDRFKPVLGLT
jgi:hypothetical protein